MSRKTRSRKPKSPVTLKATTWDQGASGPANRVNLVTEERGEIDTMTGKKINPNGVKGVRRVDMLEFWHKRGTISTAGYNAATDLRDAYEGTQRAKGWPEAERVQSSPKPDMAVTIQIDRLSRFHQFSKHIPAQDRPMIGACVLEAKTPAAVGYIGPSYQRGLIELKAALDRLARNMGY
jgi:hypothetical protein